MDNFIDYVETLSSDDFEGRAPGTPGGIKTKNFISEKFSEFGLEGLDGSYLRDVKLTDFGLSRYMPEESSYFIFYQFIKSYY